MRERERERKRKKECKKERTKERKRKERKNERKRERKNERKRSVRRATHGITYLSEYRIACINFYSTRLNYEPDMKSSITLITAQRRMMTEECAIVVSFSFSRRMSLLSLTVPDDPYEVLRTNVSGVSYRSLK